VETFAGKRWILLIALAAFYLVPTLLTLWLVRLLYRFTYKLSARGQPDVILVRQQSLIVLVVTFASHATALYLEHFLDATAGVALFLIPIAMVVWLSVKDRELVGMRKALAALPLYLYVVADVILLLQTAG
jgi:hypothetical protein